MKAKTTKKEKPYTLTCDKGIVCELANGIFIGDSDGCFTTVTDICDAYIGVAGEFDDEIDNYGREIPFAKGYPRIYKVEKTLKVISSKTLKLN